MVRGMESTGVHMGVYFYRVVREDLKEVRTLTIHAMEISDM